MASASESTQWWPEAILAAMCIRKLAEDESRCRRLNPVAAQILGPVELMVRLSKQRHSRLPLQWDRRSHTHADRLRAMRIARMGNVHRSDSAANVFRHHQSTVQLRIWKDDGELFSPKP